MSAEDSVPVIDSQEAEYDEQNAAADDKAAAKSEQTGKISSDEVEGLKDTIGGGETLDDETGVKTRGVKNDALKQEREVDNIDLEQ